MTDSEAFSELYYTMQAIKLVTGLTPKCWYVGCSGKRSVCGGADTKG